ncbi:MAG: 16S rRNA (adenine(1518)-N(6)/adenine(1519)-N(6))-dimethyltransferase RsmA [Clostridia bacterium]|nr:16S rRNA (adenine(1518)-N(6)/adenine(1519)-N(6))-dimethyltransferase RsmA [Clostridia bacterium]
MSRLSDISYIRDVMGRHGVSFDKSKGQNFLINPSVCPKMAEMSGAADEAGAVEIGPGIGVLTYELSQVADKVVSIELDKRLLPILDETLSDCDNVKIVNEDAMKIDLRKLIEEEFDGKKVAVCANLPYYITSPIIMRLLEEKLPISSVTVMVQKEAADRLCAEPGSRECGAVSAAVRYYSNPKILFRVNRGSFMPAPNVDSAVIRLDILDEPPVKADDEKFFFKFIKAAFGQRRKTLTNSLSSGLGVSKDLVREKLAECGLNEKARAEELKLDELCMLANAIGKDR